MRHDFIDRYSRLESPVHRLPAIGKFVAAIFIIVVIIGVPMTWFLIFPAIMVILLLILYFSSVPWLFVIKRLFFLELLILGIALLSLLQPQGSIRFFTIVMKSTLCILTVILLSNTTQFSELLTILRRFHLPAIFITVLALMYRYLFVLIDETERMHRARLSRTFVQHKTQLWYSLATLIGQLFVRSTERAEKIYSAMTARGWK
ncbi:MAG: cobalt ECF transporter T component CbiQ [Bacteroidota bacterium]